MRRLAVITLALLTAAGLSACGPKRPPNLASATGEGGQGSDASRNPSEPMTRPDEGAGALPVDPSGLSGEDLPSSTDATTEGGPLEDIYFEFDQYALTDAAKATLETHASWLKARPAAKVMVEGHCDERGTVEYNLALGDKRARAVRDHLEGLGVPGARLQAISLGKERPKDQGSSEAAWAQNRRAHFAVSR